MGIFKDALSRLTGKNRMTPEETERQELIAAVRLLREQHRLANLSFEYATEPEQVEASVYELKAIQARYDQLIRLAREKGAHDLSLFKQSPGLVRSKEA